MKVFVDYHHQDLYYSLHRLFVERLGWELYRPIGMDWFPEFWKIGDPYPTPRDTAGQFLGTETGEWDQFKNLNGQNYQEDGIYHIFDPAHDFYHKAVTLDQFKKMQFDVVISTYDKHEPVYDELVRRYQPNAKRVTQLGNVGWSSSARNVLASVPFTPSPDQNVVFYHQEVDPKFFQPNSPNPDSNKIYSFVNLLPRPEIFNQYKEALSEFDFKAFGSSSPDGALPGAKGIAPVMKEAKLGWHIKPLDGFGHVVMDWWANGRGLITQLSDLAFYDDPSNKYMYEDQVTCINLEARSFEENLENIRFWMKPENAERMSENVRKRFAEVFNYDKEEQEIRKFFERMFLPVKPFSDDEMKKKAWEY